MKNINQNQWKNKIIQFLTAQTVSLLGSSLVQYSIVWYITLATSSGAMLTISTICGFAPQIIISIFAGVWIDRYNRKRLIMISDGMIAVATLILAIVFLTGYKNLWVLFIVLAVRSAGTGIQTPAVNALIPQIVPKEHLMKIIGVNSTILSLIMFLSPALSGAILSVSPLETVLFIDVVTAMIGIGITLTIAVPNDRRAEDIGKSSLHDIKMGFVYLKENSFVKRLMLFQIIVLFLISPSAFLTPLMVSRTFGMEVWRLTLGEMTYSAGTALGGILIVAWGGFKNRMDTTILAGTAYGILMIAMGLSPVFPVYLVFNLLIGVTAPCYNSPITVMIQEKVEPSMHGRVFSFMQIATSCTLPIGMVLFGPIADKVRIQSLLIIAGSLVTVCTVVAAWLFHRRISDDL
jgi:DHA3 family macrolide efflux protein-like MFS transporter